MRRAYLVALMHPHPLAVRLALILLGAASVAEDAGQILARRLQSSAVATPRDASLPAARPVASGNLWTIAERNLFGAAREPLGGAAATPSVRVLRPCRSLAEVRATLVAAGFPAWSAAVLAPTGSASAEVYTLNTGANLIAPGVEVVEIRECAVVLARGDERELCRCEATQAQGSARGAADGGAASVRRVSANVWEVDRAVVEAALADLPRTATQIRLVPVVDGRQVSGFTVHNVQPASLFAQLGLRRGDVIESVEGQSLSDADSLLALYRRLRESSSVSVEVRRAGRRQTWSYALR